MDEAIEHDSTLTSTDQVLPGLCAYNKQPRVSKKKDKVEKPREERVRKRQSILDKLKNEYVTKVLIIDRCDIVGGGEDGELEYHVTGVCRKKADGVMAPFVTMTCVTNKRWSLKDVPLSKYKNQLDLAESIKHTLLPEVSEETHNAFTSKRNSK